MANDAAKTGEPSPEAGPSEQPVADLWWLLMEVANLSRRLAERRLALLHTSPDQIHALRAVVRQERMTVGEIADAVGLERNSASQLVERLVQQGLVQRHRSTIDRRQAFVSASDRGREVLQAGEPGAVALASELLLHVSPGEVDDSVRVLREMRARAARMLAGPAPDPAPANAAVAGSDAKRTAARGRGVSARRQASEAPRQFLAASTTS